MRPPIIAMVMPAPLEGSTMPAASPTSRWLPLTKEPMEPDIGRDPAPLNSILPPYLEMNSSEYSFRLFPRARDVWIPRPMLAPPCLGNFQAYPPGATEPKWSSSASSKSPDMRTNLTGMLRDSSSHSDLRRGSLWPAAPMTTLAVYSEPSLRRTVSPSTLSTLLPTR